jgi:hypothetical protein
MTHPLDSFDNNKKRCSKCKKFFDITKKHPLNLSGLCEKCFDKFVKNTFKSFKNQLLKKNYPNKVVNSIKNKYYSNDKWFKNE